MAEHFAATNHFVQTEPLFRHGDGSYKYQEPSQRYESTCMIKRLAQ